jgi:hypothetical protein
VGSSRHKARARRGIVPWVALVVAAAIVIVALLQTWWNHRAFGIDQVTFQAEATGDWQAPSGVPTGFVPVHLPHFNAGYFRIHFRSTESQARVEMYARDCLLEANLDGKRIFERAKSQCRNCSFTGGRLCESVPLQLELRDPGPHVLALRTHNVPGPDAMWNRDFKILWVEHEGNAGGWRALALLGIAFLLTMVTIAVRRRSIDRAWIAIVGRLRRYRYVLFAFAVVMSLRVMVSPAHVTGDVSQATLVYVENIVHADTWRLTKLDPVYRAAKHKGKSYMHKPPGLYYQYIPARLWFGFTHLYYVYLARLPGILGDLLIGLGLFVIVKRKTRSANLANLAAVIYLAAPGTFLVNGFIGRVDSLPVAFLLLAANNMHRRRFSIYFGISALLKQLAVIAGPWFLLRPGMFRKVVLAALVTLVFMSPFIFDDPKLLIERMVSPQLTKPVSGLTWMSSLKSVFGVIDLKSAASGITVGYLAVLVFCSPFLAGNPHRVLAWIYVSFVLFARNVAEHYMLWPAPFLIAHCFISRRTFPLVIFGVLQMSGLMMNDRGSLLHGDVRHQFSLALGVILAVYVLSELPHLLRPRETWRRAVEAVNRLRGSPHDVPQQPQSS